MKITKDHTLLILLGAILFLPFLGGAHLFDWDEINFAEAAREMIATGDYFHVQINFEPFWEKPPFFIWLQVAAMKVFGVNEFAARFPNALCGILTILFLFSIGKKMQNRTFGWLWVGLYLGSFLPHLYFRSGIIDPWFNLLIFSSLYFFVSNLKQQENIGGGKIKADNLQQILLAGALLGLAVLTKGPAAILIVGLTFSVYFLINKFQVFSTFQQLMGYVFSAIFVTALWFGIEVMINGTWFIKEFILYQIRLFSTPDAGHGGFPGYHFVVLLLGCFPASVFAIPSFRKNFATTPLHHDFRKWMLVLFWVVLILFSLVQSKIVHYSSLCYFPLTYLGAIYLFSLLKNKKPISKSVVNGLFGIGILISLVFLALPLVGKNIQILKPLFKNDTFALGNLEAEVPWSYFDLIPGILLLFILISTYVSFKKNQDFQEIEFRNTIVKLLSGMTLVIACSLYFFVNKIEGYSQNAAIEFYKSLQGKNVYVKNVGFKSYAPLFYTKKGPGQRPESKDLKWLTRGKINKDVYLVAKIRNEHSFDHLKEIQEIGRKNGFIFFKRKVKK